MLILTRFRDNVFLLLFIILVFVLQKEVKSKVTSHTNLKIENEEAHDTIPLHIVGYFGNAPSPNTPQGTEYVKITTGAGTPVDVFTIDENADVTIAGDLQVDLTTTLSNLLSANGGIEVDGTKFTVDGANTGNVDTEGTLNVDGATTLNGAVTLGNAAGDDIKIRGTIKPNAANVVPVIIQGLASQSAALINIENSAGSDKLTLDKDGNLILAGHVTVGSGTPAAAQNGYVGSSTFTTANTFTSSTSANQAFTTGNPKFFASNVASGLRVDISQAGVYLVTGSVTISASGLQEAYAVLKMDNTGTTSWASPAYNAKGQNIILQKVDDISAITATCPSSTLTAFTGTATGSITVNNLDTTAATRTVTGTAHTHTTDIGHGHTFTGTGHKHTFVHDHAITQTAHSHSLSSHTHQIGAHNHGNNFAATVGTDVSGTSGQATAGGDAHSHGDGTYALASNAVSISGGVAQKTAYTSGGPSTANTGTASATITISNNAGADETSSVTQGGSVSDLTSTVTSSGATYPSTVQVSDASVSVTGTITGVSLSLTESSSTVQAQTLTYTSSQVNMVDTTLTLPPQFFTVSGAKAFFIAICGKVLAGSETVTVSGNINYVKIA